MSPLVLTVMLIATLPIWIGIANFNLVATLFGILFVGLAIVIGFSFVVWVGVAFWLAGFVAVVFALRVRERHLDSGGEEERRNRELIAVIQAWTNSHQSDSPKEIPLRS